MGGGGGGGSKGGALGCPHKQFASSVNVAINYKILAVITAEMKVDL